MFATGEDIVIDDLDALNLAAITTSVSGASDTSSDVLALTNLTGNNGDLVVTTNGSITDTVGQTITVADTTSLEATSGFDILIANDAGGMGGGEDTGAHTFASSFHANGEQIRVRQSGTLTQGTITGTAGTNDSTISESAGDIFLTEGGEVISGAHVDLENITLGGAGVITAPDVLVRFDSAVTIADATVDAIAASNVLTVRTTGTNNITIDGVTTTIPTVSFVTSDLAAGSTGNSAGGDILFNTTLSSFANLRAIAGGDISQTAGVTTTGTAYFLAADNTVGGTLQNITLDNAANDFGGIVDAIASGAVSLRDTNGIDLGLVSAGFGETDTSATGRNLTVTSAGGNITQQAPAGREIFVRGDADGAGGVLVTDQDRAITAIATNDLEGARVESADTTSLTATSGNITLSGANNDFDRLSSADPDAVDPTHAAAGNIVLNDRDAIALGVVTATTNLTVTAEGSITDTGTDAISVTGTTSLLAYDDMGNGAGADDDFFDIALDNDAHNFGGAVSATGEDITLTDTGAILLGAISTNEGAQTDLITPNAANLGADTDQDVSVDATIATNGGDLVVRTGGGAAGDITQDASGLFIEGSTSLSAGAGAGDVTLTQSTNDFDQDAEEIDNTLANFGDAVDEVDILADVVQITDDTAIALGSVTAGTLTVTSGGTMTDTAGEGVSVTGTTTLTAQDGANNYDILLDNADIHNFDSDAGPSSDATDGVFATGEDIVINDVDALNLAAITTSPNGAADTSSDVLALTNLTGNDGDLVVTTNGSITDTVGAAVSVTGTTSLLAYDDMGNGAGADDDFFDIELDNDSHNFVGAVSATGEDITLTDTGAILLGAIFTNEGGQTDLITPNAVNLGADTDQDASVDATIATNGGDLVVRTGGGAAGDITQDTSGLFIEGSTSLSAGAGSGDVTLTESTNDFDQDAEEIDSTLGNFGDALDEVDILADIVQITDDTAIALGSVTAGTLTVTSGGTMTDTTGEAVSVTGATTLTARDGTDFFDIVLDDDGDFTNTPVHDFGGAVTATGEDIALVDLDDIILGNISANGDASADTSTNTGNDGDLKVQASTATTGTITQLAGTSIVAGGLSDFVTEDSVITLSELTNNFATVTANTDNDADNLARANVTIYDTNAVTLGAIEAQDLLVTSEGSMVDTGDAIIVAGTTSLLASDAGDFYDIQLDGASNQFTGAITASGEDIHLANTLATNLGAIVTRPAAGVADTTINTGQDGDFTLTNSTTGLGVTQSGVITAPGDLTIDTEVGAVILTGANDFGSISVTTQDAAATGTFANVQLNDVNAIDLGVIEAAGLTITAGGSVTDDAAGAIDVSGTTSITASSGGGFFDVVLDDANIHDFDTDGSGDSVNISAEDIVLDDVNNIVLGTISANGDATPDTTYNFGNDGDLVVRAGGTITDTNGQGITVGNDATFQSDGSGTGTEALLQSVGGVVNVTGANNVIAVNSGNLTIGTTSLGGDTVFDALTGNVVVTGPHSVSNGSLFLIAENGDIDLSNMTRSGAGFTASESIALLAPNGGIIMPADVVTGGLQFVAGATGPSLDIGTQLASSSVNSGLVTGVTEAIELEFAKDLIITVPSGSAVAPNGLLDFDTTGTVKFTLNNGADFAIGESNLTSQVGSLAFDPVQFAGTLRDDELLLSVDGGLQVLARGGVSTFNVQNTNAGLGGANQGEGTIIANDITLEQTNGGSLLQFAVFGSVSGRDGTNAAIGTVTLINFTPDQNHTINGCVIGTVSSCTPLGTLTLNLQFETGQFLGITFVDPDEDEDDPFTNRGDEEEWE
ncbi:MAG: hypothetical protein AAF479_04735 [Pseudomonadota bacterium]